MEEEAGTGAAVGEQIALLANIHIPEGDSFDRYNSSPPTSGSHWATGWARCGIYDDEGEVPDERIVHNMEHGQVIISYNLTDDAEVERLKDRQGPPQPQELADYEALLRDYRR